MMADIKALFEQWIAAVTVAIDSLIRRLVPRRKIMLSQENDNSFKAKVASERNDLGLSEISFRLVNGQPVPPLPPDWQAAFRGCCLEVMLLPSNVLFRTLDFPKQAVDFLDGMIRTQIDRLTPWTPADAIFGWSAPLVAANERVELMLAATSKQVMQPLVQLASALGATSIMAYANSPIAGAVGVNIKIFERSLRETAGGAINLPRVLRMALLSTAMMAAASLFVTIYIGSALDSEQQQLQRRISERRASLRLSPNMASSALNLLAKRKQTTPSSVVVLEALSQALPDSTYVTELRIEGDKLQVVGMTQDAPSLIRLMERSPQFTRATFFAPTTRAQNDPGERFHIEAHLSPSFGSGT
jgi:general secretion pathway protein L